MYIYTQHFKFFKLKVGYTWHSVLYCTHFRHPGIIRIFVIWSVIQTTDEVFNVRKGYSVHIQITDCWA